MVVMRPIISLIGVKKINQINGNKLLPSNTLCYDEKADTFICSASENQDIKTDN